MKNFNTCTCNTAAGRKSRLSELLSFPLTAPDRVVETEEALIFEWQQEGYFEIEKLKDSDCFEIMLVENGVFEHWELRKI